MITRPASPGRWRAPVALALALALAGAGAATDARAADGLGPETVAEIADALRADRLYLDPALGEAFTDEQVNQLQTRLGQAETPIYLAVLATDEVIQASEEQSRQVLANEPTGEPTDDPEDPLDGEVDEPLDEPTESPDDEATESPDDEPTAGATANATPSPSASASASASASPTDGTGGLPGEIARAMNVPGTYAVVEGTSFHATSTVIPGVEALAAEATASGADTTTALLEFVDAVDVAAGKVGGPGSLDDAKKGTNSSTWVLALVVVGAVLLLAMRRKPKPPA